MCHFAFFIFISKVDIVEYFLFFADLRCFTLQMTLLSIQVILLIKDFNISIYWFFFMTDQQNRQQKYKVGESDIV